jgi:hypothetical protein
MLNKQIHKTLADLETKYILLDDAEDNAKKAEEHKNGEARANKTESSGPSASGQPSCFKKKAKTEKDATDNVRTATFENPLDNEVDANDASEDEENRAQGSDASTSALAADSDRPLGEEDPDATAKSHAESLTKRLAKTMKEVDTTKALLAQAQAELKAANDQTQAVFKTANDQTQAELKAANDALQQTQDRNDRLTKEVARLKQVQEVAAESSGTTNAAVVQSQPEVKATTRQTKDEADTARLGAISSQGDPQFHRGELLAATQKVTVRTTRKKGSHHVVELKEEDTFEVLDIVTDTWLQVQTQTVKGKDLAKTGWVKPLDRSGKLHVKPISTA